MTKERPDRRSSLITAGGIAAVIVAGAFAVGANVGILDASSESRIGDLSAAGDLVPATSATAPASSATVPTTGPQTFVVDGAGTVMVDASGDSLVVRAVDTTPGWVWSAGPSDASHVELSFSDGARSLVFTATRVPGGGIDAGVVETTPGTPTAASVPPVPSHEDDDHEDEEHEEHEGRDDDD